MFILFLTFLYNITEIKMIIIIKINLNFKPSLNIIIIIYFFYYQNFKSIKCIKNFKIQFSYFIRNTNITRRHHIIPVCIKLLFLSVTMFSMYTLCCIARYRFPALHVTCNIKSIRCFDFAKLQNSLYITP